MFDFFKKKKEKPTIIFNNHLLTDEVYLKYRGKDSGDMELQRKPLLSTTALILAMEDQLQEVDIREMRQIVVDEEYLSYCDENDYKIDDSSLTKYIVSRTNDDVLRLWDKHPEMHHDYNMLAIPFILCFEDAPNKEKRLNLKLSESNREAIEKIIAEKINIDLKNIRVLPYIINFDKLSDYESQLYEMNLNYFEKNENTRFGKFDYQEIKTGYSIYLMTLSVCVKVEVNPIMSVEEFEDTLIKYTDENIDAEKISEILTNNNEIASNLMMPFLVGSDEFEDIYEGFKECLANIVKKTAEQTE